MTASEQATIRCVHMRAGTSKGLYFHERDLPAPGPQRDRLLKRLMGTPDVLQIDGLGGSRMITSKVAIVAPSERDDADVDYTFAQVDVQRDQVVYAGNCGNISSGVGPFAIDEGLVTATDGVTRVRIHNTNTNKLLAAEVPVANGKAKVAGEFDLPGVPGTGAEIVMDWSATVGAKSGSLLPTGNAVDTIVLEDGREMEITLSDAGNPVAWAHAQALGLTGNEGPDEINGDPALLATLTEVRSKAAERFGFCEDWRRAEDHSPGFPLIGLVAPPADTWTLNGAPVARQDMDLRVRLMFMNRLHESIAGTASISLAAASRVKGSIVETVCAHRSENVLLIGHPSGVTPVKVRTAGTGTPPEVEFALLGFSRTARRLMNGNAYYPRSILDSEPVST
jgi:2-methylaconitate cis-trans-isomerase PrpF